MTIAQKQHRSELTVILVGWLDIITAPKLEACLNQSFDTIGRLTLDFSELEHLLHEGLRVILAINKRMQAQGKMIISNANRDIYKFIEGSGYIGVLTLEYYAK